MTQMVAIDSNRSVALADVVSLSYWEEWIWADETDLIPWPYIMIRLVDGSVRHVYDGVGGYFETWNDLYEKMQVHNDTQE